MGERRGRRLAVAAGLAIILVFAASYVPTGFFTVGPGPVISLGDLISVDGYPRREGSFYMVTIVAREASAFALLKASLDPVIDIWASDTIYGGLSPEEYVAKNEALMVESRRAAISLAMRMCGPEAATTGLAPSSVSIGSGEVVGPSAGLAFALEIVSRVSAIDLLSGRKVSATGMLKESGDVSAVGGIAMKAAACLREGIDLFVVPAGQEREAGRDTGPMKVVGVRSLDEAVRYLEGK